MVVVVVVVVVVVGGGGGGEDFTARLLGHPTDLDYITCLFHSHARTSDSGRHELANSIGYRASH